MSMRVSTLELLGMAATELGLGVDPCQGGGFSVFMKISSKTQHAAQIRKGHGHSLCILLRAIFSYSCFKTQISQSTKFHVQKLAYGMFAFFHYHYYPGTAGL